LNINEDPKDISDGNQHDLINNIAPSSRPEDANAEAIDKRVDQLSIFDRYKSHQNS